MKKGRLLNSEISSVISRMGHTDHITVGDAGLPIPNEVKRIDLAVEKGVPTFLGTLEVILEELKVEEVVIAKEMKDISGEFYTELLKLLEIKNHFNKLNHLYLIGLITILKITNIST